jgi:hypothetical protein
MAISDEDTAAWTDTRLRELAVPADSQPRQGRVQERLRVRDRQRTIRRRTFAIVAASASAILLLFAVSPSSRLVAQRVWRKLRPPKDIVVVRQEDDPRIWEGGFLHWEYLQPFEPAQHVETLGEAAKLAGFKPRLPDWNILGQRPTEVRFGVIPRSAARVTIDAKRLREMLQEKGRKFDVPQAWDGAQFISESGPTIVAIYDGGSVMLAQQPPNETRVPADIPLAQIWSLFEAPPGLSTEAVRRLTEEGVLQGIDPDPEIDVHDVQLKSGHAIFVKNNSDHETRTRTCFFCPVYPHQSVIVWIVPDRQFVLRADHVDEESLVRLANAIP